MKSLLAGLILITVSLWGMSSFAQQQPRYPVDPETKHAVGAKQKPADELKDQVTAGNQVMIIDVRQPASFQKETIPGAINIPLAELEDHLKKLPKDTLLVFT